MHPGRNASRKVSRSSNRRSEGEKDCDTQLLDQGALMRTLPKGIIRGCSRCDTCQKVVARYKPEASCRPDLDEAPIYYPTAEEFEDAISYIAKIRPEAENYGICRIVPPSSWIPPIHLAERSTWEYVEFPTRVQRVDMLQNRMKLSATGKKRRRSLRSNAKKNVVKSSDIREQLESGFGFQPGPAYTLDAFERYDKEFKACYFRGLDAEMGTNDTSPSIDAIEGEYWRIVERPTEEIEVLYGADLDTRGFLKTSVQAPSPDDQYINSEWNLNKLPRLPGSVLTYEDSVISGIQVPWLYVGMCFSSFCWHVEDHFMYSINYMHFGAPKMWYGVPGKDATKLEQAMVKHLPELFEEQPDLLHKLITQFSPKILKSEGVPVYRSCQSPGEFIVTFPRSYHAGFNCGFNCAEAVNFAPVDWFPHGLDAVELYCEQGRKITLSHDKLLIEACNVAVKAKWQHSRLLGKNATASLIPYTAYDNDGNRGILAKSLKTRVRMERVRRDMFCEPSQVQIMPSSFDQDTERVCSICNFDLHLSAAGCCCSPQEYACLNHANVFCRCGPSKRFFLFRYPIDDLNILVEALEGSLSAVYKWGHFYLGLSLSPVSEEKRQSQSSKAGTRNPVPEKEVIYIDSDEEDEQLDSERNPENSHCQESPCVATVDEVELLELGAVVSGELWSCNHAIFPKGFRSRVTYINILDPTRTTHYVSEVQSWGAPGPLFMVFLVGLVSHHIIRLSRGSLRPHTPSLFGVKGIVSLEECPSEVFIHIRPTGCWEMVLERVNREIAEQREAGKTNLSRPQPPGSINGFEMFGFTSPPIIQAIEALDVNRTCKAYWESRPLAHGSQSEAPLPSPADRGLPEHERHLRRLFNRATDEQLHSLSAVSRKEATDGVSTVGRLADEEIQNRQ